MLTWIQLNYGWIFAFVTVLIALGKILLYFRDQIKDHSEKIKTMQEEAQKNKTETSNKMKVLEDTIRCRDEAILNKLDIVVTEISEMKIGNAKLLGLLSGKGVIKSEDL